MFGCQGGASGEILTRKRGYRADAQGRWPFLARSDLTTVHNEPRLATVVRDRTALPKDQADDAVHRWMVGKTF